MTHAHVAQGRNIRSAMGLGNKKIRVGSANPSKIEAVREILLDYSHLKDFVVAGFEVRSGVSDQPKSLEETIRGAMNRSKGAFDDCSYSFGIESGLMQVPNTKSGYMDVCVCSIFDGREYHLGLSSAWEAPKQVMELMLQKGLNMSDAAYHAGFTENPNVGAAEGLIGIMTKGRLDRKKYTKEAIRTALIHIDIK
jgi:inosine/xanthosine triphosphatase